MGIWEPVINTIQYIINSTVTTAAIGGLLYLGKSAVDKYVLDSEEEKNIKDRDNIINKSTPKWDDIKGIDNAKGAIEESIIMQIENTNEIQRLGIEPPTGVLLYGPPGTGKTALCESLSSKLDINVLKVTSAEVLSKWYGESEKAIKEIFEKASENSSIIIFIDEIDALAPGVESFDSTSDLTRRVVTQLQVELDNISDESKVAVVATTNYPTRIDPSLIRPGRFDRLIRVHSPDRATRKKILKSHTSDMPVDDVDFDHIAKETAGFVGSDLEALVKQSALSLIQSDKDCLKTSDFKEVLSSISPTMAGDQKEYYENIEEELSNSGTINKNLKGIQ
jgi:transitional endoplasmic reticulum ATPase